MSPPFVSRCFCINSFYKINVIVLLQHILEYVHFVCSPTSGEYHVMDVIQRFVKVGVGNFILLHCRSNTHLTMRQDSNIISHRNAITIPKAQKFISEVLHTYCLRSCIARQGDLHLPSASRLIISGITNLSLSEPVLSDLSPLEPVLAGIDLPFNLGQQ